MSKKIRMVWCLLAVLLPQWAGAVGSVPLPTRGGTVVGHIAACGVDELRSMWVHLAGESFQARPDDGGNFVLYFVPEGGHELVIESFESRWGSVQVEVRRRTLHDIGSFSLRDFGGCPAEYLPVCGVDGVTYSSGCEARLSCVEVAHEGECED